ncbi:MAG: hypothetical protein EBY24_20180, partial [Betaproteobacteria bacterium]|nr:hypothetical protein [Betaproteobacteria bacterium]
MILPLYGNSGCSALAWRRECVHSVGTKIQGEAHMSNESIQTAPARQGLTRAICEIIHAEHQRALSPELTAAARQAILDGLAVGVAGTTERAPQIAAEHAQSQGGHPVSTVLALGFKTSPVLAAAVNGMAIHVLDFEAMWSPPTHTTSPTLPVVLALAESQNRTGADILRAFVAGCEIQGRLRLASGQYELEGVTFHPPGVVGVVGAAVAASCIMGAGVEQLRHAIGLAASRAGSLIGNVGSMAKCTHCGTAA